MTEATVTEAIVTGTTVTGTGDAAKSPGADAPVRFVAFNYAEDSENRIHADGEAQRFGFRGGLVPGVADYAYISSAVGRRWGAAWLSHGTLEVKLLSPVYDGEAVTVVTVDSTDSDSIALELRREDGELCAVASATLAGETGGTIDDFEAGELPSMENRPAATLAELPPGRVLGELAVKIDASRDWQDWQKRFLAQPDDFAGAGSVHPAFYPDLGNRVLSENVLLGPWIHTRSRTRHHALPQDGESVRVRARVRDSYERRGHDIVVLDVGFFGDGDRSLASVEHHAIIRPRDQV